MRSFVKALACSPLLLWVTHLVDPELNLGLLKPIFISGQKVLKYIPGRSRRNSFNIQENIFNIFKS